MPSQTGFLAELGTFIGFCVVLKRGIGFFIALAAFSICVNWENAFRLSGRAQANNTELEFFSFLSKLLANAGA